jgi:hypothetical protein
MPQASSTDSETVWRRFAVGVSYGSLEKSLVAWRGIRISNGEVVNLRKIRTIHLLIQYDVLTIRKHF